MRHPTLPQPLRAQESESLGRSWMEAMERGDFAAAWQVSDQVLAGRDPARRDDPSQPYHLRWLWDGRPPDGRRVLVRCYHGLGDTLQFARFLPALRRRAAHVTLELQPELLPLLRGYADRAVPFDPAAPVPEQDCTLEIMELCHALRIAPDPRPYLPAAASGPRRGIGLCWRVTTGFRPERSVPDAALAPLLGLPGIQWIGLQRGAAFGLAEPPAALADTARLVAGLAAVVTVDTMVAHLAGALGTPVHLLLDAGPDWRWRAEGAWYAAVRSYRQQRPGDWAPPLAALARELSSAGHVAAPAWDNADCASSSSA